MFVIVAISLADGLECRAKFSPPSVLHGFLNVSEDLERHMGFSVERIVDVETSCCRPKMFHVGGDGLAEIKLEVDEYVELLQNVAVVGVDGPRDGCLH